MALFSVEKDGADNEQLQGEKIHINVKVEASKAVDGEVFQESNLPLVKPLQTVSRHKCKKFTILLKFLYIFFPSISKKHFTQIEYQNELSQLVCVVFVRDG